MELGTVIEQQQLIAEEDSPRRVQMESLPTASSAGFHLTSKKVIVLLVSAVAVLGCALALNLVHMNGTPAFTAETTSTEPQEEDYLSMPAAAAPPVQAAPAVERAPPAESAAPSRPAGAMPATVAESGEPADIGTYTQLAASEDDSGNDTLATALKQRQMEPRCLDPVHMTPCSGKTSRWPTFFFDGRRCLTPVSVPPPGCLEGPNRFRSLGHCRGACQGQGARAECREPARLVPCSREHVKRRWFYPANGSCVEWGFPEGSCVNIGLRLFQSMQQCLLDCVQHNAPGCREYPVGQRCGEYQVNFPVFSAVNKNGHFECLTVDPAEKLCLLGSNMFHSYRTCARACLIS
ncbi:uncharacterized protein [Dermacentor albipictus]|uniref:uncharacterized protein isoform X1 n=2 Tax=Dermacentor albipictus TaxID=60249 RepID=UPI0031FE3C28